MDILDRVSQPPSGGFAMLIVDPQVDFHEGGSLGVPGATADSYRIAKFIDEHAQDITQITITLDSHQHFDIAHGVFWRDAQGNKPEPFTQIAEQDVRNGTWTPANPILKEYAVRYTQALAEGGRFTLMIWPEHCVIATPGHAIVEPIRVAAGKWATRQGRAINYVWKGSNPYTEMYSALRADVEVASDPSSMLNTKLIQQLQNASKVIITGQALSHCVNFTTRDLVEQWCNAGLDCKRVVLLSNCSSAVPSFEKEGQQFITDMKAKGLTITTSDDSTLTVDL